MATSFAVPSSLGSTTHSLPLSPFNPMASGTPHPFLLQKQNLNLPSQTSAYFSRVEPPVSPATPKPWLEIKPYNPFINTNAFLRAGLLTAAGFGLAFLGTRRLFKKSFQHSRQHTQHKVQQNIKQNLQKRTENLKNTLTHQTTFYNISDPTLSLMTMVNTEGWGSMALLYGITSIGGYLASTALKGIQAAWVRDEQTQLRMQAMDTIANDMAQSMQQKEDYLQQLKQNTWQSIENILRRHGISNTNEFQPAGALPSINTSIQRNFLQEIRSERINPEPLSIKHLFTPSQSTSPNKSALLSQSSLTQGSYFGKQRQKTLNTSQSPPENRSNQASINILDPVFLGLGGSLGLVSQGARRTWKEFQALMTQAKEEVAQQFKQQSGGPLDMPNLRHSMTITLKNSEALVPLLKDLNNPRLIVGLGLATGLFSVGKLLLDGLREIKVYQQNAKTEIKYQRYNWQNLGFKLQRTAEETWLKVQLNALQNDVANLKRSPDALKKRIENIMGHIGLNSPPSYYTTPVEFNEPYYWHYADN